MLSFPEMNLTSSLPFGKLEYVLHILLSPVSLQQVSPVQLIFEMTYGPLDLAYPVVRSPFSDLVHTPV